MSRCFPFPPPGYVKNPRPEEDLLKEDKRKEKKHKKDKKDKEKREGKDKKDKDKGDDKHKEKKDKKEKHRDKKDKHRDKKDKEKDKGKDKEKSRSEDANVTRQPETKGGEKFHTREENLQEKSRGSEDRKLPSQFQGQNGQNSLNHRFLAKETEERKFVQELDRRIRDDGKAVGSKPVEKLSGADHREDKGTHRFSTRDPLNLAEDKERNRDRKIDDRKAAWKGTGDEAVGSKPVEKLSGADYREDKGTNRFSTRDPFNLAEDKEKNRDRKIDDRKVVGKGPGDEARFNGSTFVQTFAGPRDLKVEDMPVSAHGDTERTIEVKDRSKGKGDDKRGEKRKEKKDKKSHGKDKVREKDKKEEEMSKDRAENKKNNHDSSMELIGNEPTAFSVNTVSHPKTDDHKQLMTLENMKKRKDVGANGFLHDNEVRPNKLSRPTSHQLPENGRILEAHRTPTLVSSDKQGATSGDRMDNKDHRGMNGIIEAPSFHVSNHKSPLAATRSDKVMEVIKKHVQSDQVAESPGKLSQASQVTEVSKKHRQANQIAEPPRKPPHPDMKYLSQVLSVPKMDEWSEVDNQDWLFSGKGPPSKKPEVASSGNGSERQVWSEALLIESAEIYALPYVLPY